MPAHLRRSPWPAILICAALALALLAPSAASANAAGATIASKQATKAERRADREAQREARATQRSERHSAKQATREATRSERQAEREARRAAREAERTNGSHTIEAPTSTEPAGGEPTPGETEKAPEGVVEAPIGTRPSLTPRAGCSLTVATSAAQVTVGESVTLSGKLSCPSGIEVSGQEVTIDQRESAAPGAADTASSSFAPVDTAAVAEDGSYEFHSAALTTRSTFVVRFSGTRRSARVVVRVNAGVTLESSATSGAPLAITAGKAAGGPSRVTFSGVVQPAAAGVGVGLLVRYVGQQWRTVAFAHTDDEGHYSFSHRFRVAGEVEVATVAHPHGEQRTESTPLSYTIVSGSSSPGTNQGSGSTPTSTPTPATPAPTSPGPTSPAPAS